MAKSTELHTQKVLAILRETEMAILIEVEGGEEIWLPLSNVHEIKDRDGDCSIVMTAWIAKQKGLL